MTLTLGVFFEEKTALSPEDRPLVEALTESCRVADGVESSLPFETHLNAIRSMPAWFLAWGTGKGEGGGRTLLGALCVFAPTKAEGEISAAVDPLYRKQGIFLELYAMARRALQAAGVPSLLLAADGRLAFGRSLAERLGARRSHGEYRMALDRCDAAVGRQSDALRFVPVTGESLEGAVALSVEAFGDDRGDARAFIAASLADPAREQFIAMSDRGPVGMATVSVADGIAMINGLGVAPSARGAGVGGAILDTCLAILFARGFARVALEVSDENAAAIGLYRSRGFRDESRTDYWRVDITKDDRGL